MHRISAALLTIAAFASVAMADDFPFAATGPMEVPDITFEDRDGNPVTMDDFAGKLVVLNLWATWCAPCRREMPALDRLQAELGGPDFEVVALAVDRAGVEKVARFLDEVGVEHLAIYMDPKAATSRALRAYGLPTTVIFDGEGRELGRVQGAAEWDSDEAKALFRDLMQRRADGGVAAESGTD